MNFDDAVRGTLCTRAEEIDADPALLDRVRHGVRRDVRRRVVTASLAVGALVALAAGTPYALGVHSGRARPTPQPAASATASGSAPRAVPPSGLIWSTPEYSLPAFPLTPGWEPPGLRGRWIGAAGADAVLGYLGSRFTTTIGPAPYKWDWESANTSATTVNGRPASLRTGTDVDYGGMDIGLTWQLADGRWVTVQNFGSGPSVADIRRFAEHLQSRPLPPTEPSVRLATAPRGFALQSLGEDQLCLAPAPSVTSYPPGPMLCVLVGKIEPPQGPTPARPTVVGGHRAEYLDDPGTEQVLVYLRDDLRFQVDADPHLNIPPAELLRFAEGITVRGE